MNFHMSMEATASGLIWSGAVVYSLYQLYLFGQKEVDGIYELTTYHDGDFEPGWFGRNQDISDLEWNSWTDLTVRLLPWLLLNTLVSHYLRTDKNLRHLAPFAYFIVSIIAVIAILNLTSAAVFVCLVTTFHAVSYTKQPILLFGLAWIWRRYLPSTLMANNEDELYIIEVAGSWMVLRSLAYSFEVCKGGQKSVGVLFGFALYLPTLFCGPLLSILSFTQTCTRSPPHLNREWSSTIVLSFMRCIFWFFITILGMHFLYANAILRRPYMVEEMTLWELAGLGIAMGQFFHLKYIVFYGLPSCWASVEGHKTPPPPCCVSTVYLYSVMWRRFDPGLYAFLVGYIYIPLLNIHSNRLFSKTVASIACFFFVFVWHGEEDYVLYWVVLNFAAVTIEGLAKELCQVPSVQRLLDETLSTSNQRRLHCLLAAPLHYFSMLANYFFIGNLEVGKIYFKKAFKETMINNMYIWMVLFGAAQISYIIEKRKSSHEPSLRNSQLR